MNKRFVIFVGFIVVIISYFYFYPPDITVHEVEASAPEKPESVPEEALWVGGLDGGVFVLIFRADEGAYSGTVYAENGPVLYQGPFRYSGDADFDVSSQSNYSFWDGNFLALRNGEKLKAVYEDGPTDKKPESIPDEAFWVDGPGGGVYVRLTRVEGSIYSGSVYSVTGPIWYQGPFQYTGDTEFDVSDKSAYDFWDGNALFMTNGKKLIATSHE